jgi:hypothetical protein
MATNGINEDEEHMASKFILDSVLRIPIERRTADHAKTAGLAMRANGWQGPKPIRIDYPHAATKKGGDRVKDTSRDRRPIHHSPVFWIGIVLCLAAIAIYVWSDDRSWRPGSAGR